MPPLQPLILRRDQTVGAHGLIGPYVWSYAPILRPRRSPTAAFVVKWVWMNGILRFDRTPVARLVSCAATFGSAALVFDYLSKASKEFEVLPFSALVLLFLGTLVAAIVQYGDHIFLSEVGVMYENRVLSWFGKHGRWMRWEDIVEVREIRRKVLILLSRDGRRMLVDAILGYAIARNEILKRAPHAVVSGTLAQDQID